MGESIGLGYRTKDIGPQLMQFQASELARRSAEKSAAKKEKKADYDKIMDKFFTIGTGKTHTSIQGEFNAANDKTKKEVETALMNDERDKAMQLIYEAAQRSNYYADRTKNYDAIEDAYKTGSKIVPEDVVNSIKGDKFTGVDGNQMTFLNALGYQYDDKTQQYIAQGFDKKNTLEELRSIPKPTKEMFVKYEVTPKFSEEQARAGYYKKGSEVYVPTDKMFLDAVGQKVQDPSFVANEVNRIAQNNSKTYVQLATATQADMAEKNKLAGVDKPITAEEVNRQMVINDLTLNHKDQWIREHTIGEDRNPIPVGGGGKSGKDDKEPVANPTDFHLFSHIPSQDRISIIEAAKRKNLYPGIENMTDEAMAEIVKNDKKATFGSFGMKAINKKQGSYGVIISQTTESINIPSLQKPVALSGIYYDKTKGQMYATGNAQINVGPGVAESAEFVQFPLTDADIRSLRSGQNQNKVVADALQKYDLNAPLRKLPTTDEILSGKKASTTTTTTKPNKITASKFKELYEKSRKQKGNENLSEAQFSQWLLANKNTTK